MRGVLFLSALFLTHPVMAQETPPVPQVQPPPQVEEGDMAAATAALERMSAKLRSFDSFELVADSTTEEVFTDGEKLQFINRVHYVVEKPDHFYASVRSDRKWRRYFYDGENLTVLAPTSGYYASAPITGSIVDLLAAAYDRYGIEVPLQDLFIWGAEGAETPELTDAFLVGFAQVDEHPTDQWFFRAPGVDFQIWIGREDDLPHRVVITNTEDEAQPQYVASLDWTPSPQIEADRFVFTPGEQNSRISLTPDTEELGVSEGAQP